MDIAYKILATKGQPGSILYSYLYAKEGKHSVKRVYKYTGIREKVALKATTEYLPDINSESERILLDMEKCL